MNGGRRMSDASIEREIGRLQAQGEAQHAQLTDLKERQYEMNEKLDTVLSFMQGAKGSWRALIAVASLASAVTAAAVKVLSLFKAP
jgi:hypothetical protein